MTTWSPIGEYQPGPQTRLHDTLEAAERDGMGAGCCRGCLRVEVYSPDGVLQALWDKQATGPVPGEEDSALANRWQRLGAESVALAAQPYLPR